MFVARLLALSTLLIAALPSTASAAVNVDTFGGTLATGFNASECVFADWYSVTDDSTLQQIEIFYSNSSSSSAARQVTFAVWEYDNASTWWNLVWSQPETLPQTTGFQWGGPTPASTSVTLSAGSDYFIGVWTGVTFQMAWSNSASTMGPVAWGTGEGNFFNVGYGSFPSAVWPAHGDERTGLTDGLARAVLVGNRTDDGSAGSTQLAAEDLEPARRWWSRRRWLPAPTR